MHNIINMMNAEQPLDSHRVPSYTTHAGPAKNKPKLLVVDDQPIHIQVLNEIFKEDCQVFMATNGQEALNICRKNLPDLVLLDVVMPGMDGFEMCRQLQADELTKHTPVIFLTAHNDFDQETQGLELGAVDFIVKPVNPAVVRARVKSHLMLKRQSDILRNLAFLDGLTGVYNRRYFDHHLQLEMARSLRTRQPLALIMLDVDYFKRFNDRYGHLAGDECLRRVATILKEKFKRPGDLVARFGGEEFVCILPETEFADAMAMANELEQMVRALGIPHEDSEVAPVLTISLGVAGRGDDLSGSVDAFVAHADGQLYKSKHSGRGQVCGCLMPASTQGP